MLLLVNYCFDVLQSQFLPIFRELISFATCADYMSNYLLKDFNIFIMILVIYVNLVLNKLIFKLHLQKKTYKLPEDGQELRPKHEGAVINT